VPDRLLAPPCLDFIAGKHQWRQGKSRLEYITDSGFAFDRRTLGDQSLDVAIDGAERNGVFCGKLTPAHRTAMSPQRLDQIEQPFRS
jgi:hypothetical protein